MSKTCAGGEVQGASVIRKGFPQEECILGTEQKPAGVRKSCALETYRLEWQEETLEREASPGAQKACESWNLALKAAGSPLKDFKN